MKRPASAVVQHSQVSSTRRRRSLALATVSQRRTERQALGSLRENLVRPYTRKLYTAAVLWFFDWLDQEGLVLPDHESEVDDVVCQALEAAWDAGEARSLAGNILSGLPHFCQALYGQLKGAWRLWKKWGELEVPCRAPPLSLKAALAIAYHFHLWGYRNEALLICLAFNRFLRTQEFLSLAAGQFTFNKRATAMHIVLGDTKSGKRKGRPESVHVTDPTLSRHFSRLCSELEAGDKLLTITVREFRMLFARALSAIGLDATFKPYSLRRGGATFHFRECGKYDLTMEVGRWSDTRTCRVYVDTALLEITQLSVMSKPFIASCAAAYAQLIEP